MKTRHRILVTVVCLGLIVALPTAAAVSAGRPGGALLGDERWLPFGGDPAPAPPELTLLGSSADAIDLKAGLPGCMAQDVEVEGQVYTKLYGEGYGFATAVGLPDLPVLRRDVEIPFGADVELELIEAGYTDYTLSDLDLHPIYPLQPPVPKTPAASEGRPFEIDREFYASDALYPSTPLALGETYVVRGHRIQTVEVWPVAYNPAAGTVRLYQRIVFRLRLSGSDVTHTKERSERYASPVFDAWLAERVLNYNQGKPGAELATKAPVGYLIVTADAYYAAMQPFVNLKDSQGFDVTITRLSDIPGGGSSASIKSYIQDAYDTWATPPSYVLLVGDTDTVPGWQSQSAGEVTDLYYGTMDGSSDWHPDIGRGRFPVRSAAQATIMVNKYLTYAELTGQEPWLTWASFIGTCDEWATAEGTHNYVIDTYTQPEGYTGTFPNNPQPGGDKLYCHTYSAGQSDVDTAVNQGRWAVIYSGHGSHTGWEFYSASDVRNLTSGGMLPFVASHACIAGDFAVAEVFGETWVLEENAGALIFWGSSDSSYWGPDDALERATFDYFFAADHADVTGMTDYGLAETEAAYPAYARYYWETYNVLGDPSVRIFRGPDAPTFTLDIEPSEHEVCASGSAISTIDIGSVLGYSETVHLETGPLPSGVTSSFDPASAAAPFTAELTLDVTPSALAGDYQVVVTATDQVSLTEESTVNLRVVGSAPATPTLVSPPDGATGQSLAPTLEWGKVSWAGSYRLQLGHSPLFAAPLIDASDVSGTSYTPGSPLEGGRSYWWRVRGENACGAGDWAGPFHFCTTALGVSFDDDVESGGGKWFHQATQGSDNWQISTAQSHSGSYAWHVPDDSILTDSRLWNTTPVAVGAGSTLTFWHRTQFEGSGSYSFDGAVLEISTDGGSTWSDLGPSITANGYNGTISTCCSNPLGGRQGWVGDLTAWTKVEVDLSSFAGQSVQIRWRIGCDFSISDVGWTIDDVQITAPLPPNPAPVVASVTPSSGLTYVDTPVQIEGSGFVATPAVRLGDTWLSVTQVDSATLEAVVPAGMAGGVYTLTLYNGDCQQATLEDAFTVFTECTSPTVSLEGGGAVEVGRPVTFTATVTGTPPVVYAWDFGGPGYGSGLDTATPAYTYTAPGYFTVTVTVDNPCGSDAISTTLDVACYAPVVVDIAASGPITVLVPVAFTATVTGTGPFTYTWDFGGPGYGSGLDTATPTFTYTSPGDYTITLTVANVCQLEDEASLEVEVSGESCYLPIVYKDD